MQKVTFSSIVITFFLVLFGGYTIMIQQTDTRTRYENSILQKASTLKGQIEIDKEELKSPDQPDMAAFQEYIMTADPATGEVPTDRLLDAYKQTKALQVEQLATRNISIEMDWESTGANMGGRTRALMFDPNDSDNKKVWAGGVTGGLWYVNDITNINDDWIPVGNFWSNLAISCIT
jgi:hypothetical protein